MVEFQDMLEEYLKDLVGKDEQPSNREIGRLFGVDESTVRRKRKRLGIPPSKHSGKDNPLTVRGSEDSLEFEGLQTPNRLDPQDVGAFRKVFELAGLDEADYRLQHDTFRFSTWQSTSGRQLYSYRGSFVKETPEELAADEAAALMQLAKTTQKHSQREHTQHKNVTRIVLAGDMQVGKVDHLGGTEELLQRMAKLNGVLASVMQKNQTETAYLFDPGDLTEGFENTASQAFSNDLSLPGMLRVGRAVLTDLVATVSANTGHTTVATVPSNHGAWRRGKGVLGRPGDDFGLEVHRGVESVFKALGEPVEWVFPKDEWADSLAVPIGNTVVGLVHGHQTKQKHFKNWWSGQALGDGPVAGAHICISGHYHNFLLETCGFLDGRERIHIQTPALDNGSSWWKNISGDESLPGMVTFLLDLVSGDISDLRTLTA